jgi:hypothetical protein
MSTPAPGPAADGPVRQRCSTAEREATCVLLHHAAGEGRLTLAETEDRVTRAYAATHRDELADLVSDLQDAPRRSGWAAVGAALWHQILADIAITVGRTQADRRTRIRAAATVIGPLLALLAFVAVVASMAVHGIVDGHEFGHDHAAFHELGRGGPDPSGT